MSHFCYAIIPIDYSWEFLPTVEEIAARFAEYDAQLEVQGERFEQRMHDRFVQRYKAAGALARDNGWEGDYRGSSTPKVFFIPSENDFEYGFVWKQDNNGTTFVLSPVPLPHLARLG